MTSPAVPVSAYAQSLIDFTSSQVALVLPYAAAVTALVIAVLMMKRWLGHASATSIGGTSSSGQRYCSYDCYDDGGCSRCSDYREWQDEDYGLVGRWEKR